MFNKINTVVIKFAKNLDLKLTYNNKALFNYSNMPSGVIRKKDGNLLTLDFSEVAEGSELHLNEKYLSYLELIESSVENFYLNEKHKLKEFNLVDSKLHIQEIYKEKIKFKLNSSKLKIDTYLISKLETFGSFSEINLGKGYILNLIKCMNFSSMVQNEFNGIILNAEQLVLSRPTLVKLNIINKCNYIFMDKDVGNVKIYGNPNTIALKKYKDVNEIEKVVSTSLYKIISRPELVNNVKKEMPINLKINKEKLLNWSDENNIEIFETDLVLYIKNKSYENILTYNIFDILKMNEDDELKIILHTLKRNAQNYLKRSKMNEKENKDKKEKQKSEELKKDIILVKEILGMDYPTDGITEDNRSVVLSVLENKQMEENALTEKESDNLKKLNFMFDIKLNKTTVKF
ncbi:MAG: hypothetical protein CL760_00755 [Chloroflexi bacterium]|nr:hypothetical protein [Chloroflexota bacterium]|tara:strand:+ start:5006 stop:6217 length:1212 start_codon:yes stop_codon:yes gene_type:complete